jgi:glycerol uptake facilitator-like aquaporin
MSGGGGFLALWLGFFILLIFSARISGSHYNPCVTLAFMLRKDAGRFNRWIGIAYMIFQTAGGFLGALFAYYVFGA